MSISRFVVATVFVVAISFNMFAYAVSATYTYDALGRVTTVTYDNGTAITYTYDSTGNLTNKTVTCGGSGC